MGRTIREAAIYRREPGRGAAAIEPPARSQVMPLQSSKEHKVNGMTSTPICSPHPNPLPQGRGVLRAGIILWGSLSPQGEGK